MQTSINMSFLQEPTRGWRNIAPGVFDDIIHVFTHDRTVPGS